MIELELINALLHEELNELILNGRIENFTPNNSSRRYLAFTYKDKLFFINPASDGRICISYTKNNGLRETPIKVYFDLANPNIGKQIKCWILENIK